MSKLPAFPLLLGTALLLASCSSGNPASPTPFAAGSSVSISAQAFPPVQGVKGMPPSGCPAATPVLVPFIVTVTPGGSVAVVVTSIITQFTDFVGLQAPAVTLPAPVPTLPFGTALEQARNPLSFSFNVCRSVNRGTVAVTVHTRDASGRNASGTVMVGLK
jgi:hypothetical protein